MPPGDLSGKAQQALGLPQGLKTYSPAPFGGINLQASAIGIADTEALWIENFVRLGDGHMRTVWDNGAAFYTAPNSTTIVYYVFYTLGSIGYVAVFLSDGSAVQVRLSDKQTVTIGGFGQFYDPATGFLPFARQWGTQYLLICNRNTVNDYWIWDGTNLYEAGTAAPGGVTILSGGSNYASAPTVTAFGGEGTGLVVTPKVSGGSVVQLEITNPGTGYEVGDVVQLAFSGGGSDTSPILTTNVQAGGVGGATITTPGSGYTTATAAFSGGGGSGAAGTVTLGSGVTSVSVTAAGSGYTTAAVTFSGGGGSGAAAYVTLSGATVGSVTVTQPGSGYTTAPTVAISGDGTGATATAAIAAGVVTGINITSPGTGYTSAPVITLTGNGSGATAVAILAPQGVNGVDVQDGGSGFTSVPLITFVGGGGAGAVGIAKLTPTSVARINVTAGGSGYVVTPNVNLLGGGGSGATAVAVLNGTAVGQILVTDGGSGYTDPIEVQIEPADKNSKFAGNGAGAGGTVVYSPTSIASVIVSNAGSGYTSAPAVEVTPGANNSAYATVSLMPYGVSGSAIETFLSRVWIVDPAQDPFSTTPPGSNFSYSAPGSVIDFATSDGGGQATNTDSFLQTRYVGVRQSSGYLYFFGDGSISVLSNVSTSGTPTVTTYNYQNVDPQAGLSWRDVLQDFGRSTIIANEQGIFGLYGGAATKISAKLNSLFDTALFPPVAGAITPTGAIAMIHGTKHYMLLMTVLDPDTGAPRNVMLTWNEKDWVVTSQSAALTQISTQKNGSDYNAWGSDGRALYPLFQVPGLIQKRYDTKLFGGDKMFIQKSLLAIWMQMQDQTATLSGVQAQLSMVASGRVDQDLNFPSDTSTLSQLIMQQPNFQAPPPFFPVWGTGTNGQMFMTIGLRFTSTSPDFILANWVLGYVDFVAMF